MTGKVMRRTFFIVHFLAILATGCATASPSGDQPRQNRNLITAEEIAEYPTLSAYHIIQLLRPAWLRHRGRPGTRASGYASVFQDGIQMEGQDALQRITGESIQRMRFIGAADATTRYGTGFPEGIIEVTTRR